MSKYSTRSRHVVESPAKIGAFNVRRFGKAKMRDAQVVRVLREIVRRYDVLLLQEVVDNSGEAVQELLEAVNEAEGEDAYGLEVSPRLGRSNAKEQYAFFYRKRRFTLARSKTYDDPEDVFEREPFAVQFKTNCVEEGGGDAGKGETDVVFLGIHIQPSKALAEIEALADASIWARKAFRSKNQIILGDFNAGGSYLNKGELDSVVLRSDKRFHWLIADHIDTTATNTLAAYDRIVVFGDMINRVNIPSAKAWRYDEENPSLKVNNDLLLRVSDHYPVEVELEAFVHPKVKENIALSTAFIVRDKRAQGLDAPAITAHCRDSNFGVESYGKGDLIRATKQFRSHEDAVKSIDELRGAFPELVSYSLLSVLKAELWKRVEKTDFKVSFEYNAKNGTINATVEYLSI